MASEVWGRLNRSGDGDALSELAEARDRLAQGQAARAEAALRRSRGLDPAAPEPHLLLLELLRLEGRVVEARTVADEALAAVSLADLREVARSATLALLVPAPEDLARETLARWIAADPDDLDARAALARRLDAMPRPGDPDASARLRALESQLSRHPEHANTREALLLALAGAGEPEQGRILLDQWPEASRDARFQRLQGRWALEHDHHSADAVAPFQNALRTLPQDWPTRARLARALRARGLDDPARQEAARVVDQREALDPEPLAQRVSHDFAHPDAPASLDDLADLCRHAGLDRLAQAWQSLATQSPQSR